MPDFVILIVGVVGLLVFFEFGVDRLTKAGEGKGRWAAILVACVFFALGVLMDHYY